MLDTCARSYYYNYYASNNGWRQDASQKTKLIYRLKKLQAIHSIVGEAIHSSITDLIINPNLTKADFKRLTNKKIRESYRNSLTMKDEWIQDPKIFKMVQDVYYFGKVKLETQQKTIEKIEACGANLSRCISLAEIKADSVIVTIDELKEFTFDGFKTYVKVDALYQNRDTGKYVVVDWKTGNGNSLEVEQLLLYVYFTHKMYNIPIEEIEARLEYCVDGDCAIYTFTSNDMNMAEKMINGHIKKMQEYMFNIQDNIPMPEIYFPENRSSKCRYCNFQEICIGDTFKKSEEEAIKFSLEANRASEMCVQ